MCVCMYTNGGGVTSGLKSFWISSFGFLLQNAFCLSVAPFVVSSFFVVMCYCCIWSDVCVGYKLDEGMFKCVMVSDVWIVLRQQCLFKSDSLTHMQ